MDVINEKKLREILVKKPFFEMTPDGYMDHGMSISEKVSDSDDVSMPEDDTLYFKVKTQKDFLREFYPTAHRIFDPKEYPDIWKQNPDDGKWYRQKIQRTAFAFQQLIHVKHVLHLTGNDVQFELSDDEHGDDCEECQRLLNKFKKGWLMHHLEIRFFEAVSAYMKVADCAIAGYFDKKGNFGTRTLSFDKGDILYPHFDSLTGELVCFARKYYDYDEDGNARTEWVEVWDDSKMYRFRRGMNEGAVKETIKTIAKFFGVSGYTCVEEKEHGFQFVPVAYMRNDDGPCWSQVQKNIEDYEEAYSYLCENNKAYAFPILTLIGDGEVEISGDPSGAAKTIAISGESKDNDAKFLNGTDASDAFATQLNKSYDLIYELSFTVKPPELKSGDLPGVAIKLLYSPAVEMATNDSQKIEPFLEALVRICKFGIGTEENCMASMTGLDINFWIEIYIHQNKTETMTNLSTAVQNGFLSKQTASERCPDFPKTGEWERIVKEKKEEQEQDLLVDIKRADNETQNAIEEKEAEAKINGGTSGNVRTGNGRKAGRPDEGKNTDRWGNRPNENNWKKFNQTH